MGFDVVKSRPVDSVVAFSLGIPSSEKLWGMFGEVFGL